MMSPEHKRAMFLLEKLAEQEYDRFFADPDHLGLEELEYIERSAEACWFAARQCCSS